MEGQNLKLKLKLLKTNQVVFASKCGVSEVQVSKWVNGHAEVPEYAQTIIELLENARTEDAIKKLTGLADLVSDGHYTICKFTSNYRVGLGTPADREFIDKMAVGSTIEEAISSLFNKVTTATAWL